MKKILFSAMAVVLSLGLMGGAFAFFSDTEESAGNTMSAATLDLQVDSGNDSVVLINLTNQQPGASGTPEILLTNAGSIAGELDIIFSAITDTADGGALETMNSTANLGTELQVAPWLDLNNNSVRDATDLGLKPDLTTYDPSDTGPDSGLVYNSLSSFDSDDFDAIVAAMANSADYTFVFDWKIPTSVENEIQGDSIGFTITFVLEQAGRDSS